MALNGTTAGTAIWNAMSGLTQVQKEDTELAYQTFMTALYADLVANGVVSTIVGFPIAVQVAPATGTGATAAPGAGTGGIS